jgi:hypothetical protein
VTRDGSRPRDPNGARRLDETRKWAGLRDGSRPGATPPESPMGRRGAGHSPSIASRHCVAIRSIPLRKTHPNGSHRSGGSADCSMKPKTKYLDKVSAYIRRRLHCGTYVRIKRNAADKTSRKDDPLNGPVHQDLVCGHCPTLEMIPQISPAGTVTPPSAGRLFRFFVCVWNELLGLMVSSGPGMCNYCRPEENEESGSTVAG